MASTHLTPKIEPGEGKGKEPAAQAGCTSQLHKVSKTGNDFRSGNRFN